MIITSVNKRPCHRSKPLALGLVSPLVSWPHQRRYPDQDLLQNIVGNEPKNLKGRITCEKNIDMYKINFSTQQISRKNTKVVVTFYLRLRNEFQQFSAKNHASDWLTCWVSKSEAWFLTGNGWNSFLNLRKKVTTILVLT